MKKIILFLLLVASLGCSGQKYKAVMRTDKLLTQIESNTSKAKIKLKFYKVISNDPDAFIQMQDYVYSLTIKDGKDKKVFTNFENLEQDGGDFYYRAICNGSIVYVILGYERDELDIVAYGYVGNMTMYTIKQ